MPGLHSLTVPSAEQDKSCILLPCIDRPHTASVWATRVSDRTLGSAKTNRFKSYASYIFFFSFHSFVSLPNNLDSIQFCFEKLKRRNELTERVVRVDVAVWYTPASDRCIVAATVTMFPCGVYRQTENRTGVSAESIHRLHIQ